MSDSFQVGANHPVSVDASAEHPKTIVNGTGADLLYAGNSSFKPAEAQTLPKGGTLFADDRVWLLAEGGWNSQSSVIVTDDAPAGGPLGHDIAVVGK
jgi:hypothetical protein